MLCRGLICLDLAQSSWSWSERWGWGGVLRCHLLGMAPAAAAVRPGANYGAFLCLHWVITKSRDGSVLSSREVLGVKWEGACSTVSREAGGVLAPVTVSCMQVVLLLVSSLLPAHPVLSVVWRVQPWFSLPFLSYSHTDSHHLQFVRY